MTVDLLGTIRLLHRVWGFLVDLSADDLRDIADGRRVLYLGDEPSTANQPTAAVSNRPVPEPRKQPASRASKPSVEELSDEDYAEIAAKLRSLETVTDGATYLSGLRLRGRKPLKADLVRVGAAMGLTLTVGTKVGDLEGRLINHAIGAKKKFAGLSRW